MVNPRPLERHRHTRVAPDIPDLLVLGQVARNKLVPIDADPHA